VLTCLLAEAIALVGADDGGIARWDDESGELWSWACYRPPNEPGIRLDPLGSASGRAAAERRPVIVNEYQRVIGPETPAGRGGAQAVVAVPIRHGARLLGTVSITSWDPARAFGHADVEMLEVLVDAAAATLIGLEGAKLRGVLLAANTAAHELNNDLALVTGYASLLALAPELPAPLRATAEQILAGAEEAAATLARLQAITRADEMRQARDLPSTLRLEAVS
jgi:GAF domain-containing protein